MSTLQDYNLTINTVYTSLLIAGFFLGFGWWLASQFKETRKLVYDQIGKFSALFHTKLEEHEKHDVERFADLTETIWELKIRNAAKDGLDFDQKAKEIIRREPTT